MTIDPEPARPMVLFVSRDEVSIKENLFSFIRHNPMPFEMIDVVFIPNEEYSHVDWRNFIDRFVLGTERLPVNEYIRAGGMEIREESCTRADLGFTMLPHFCSNGEPCGYSAEEVVIDGPAYRAGIRQGDVIAQSDPIFVQRYPPRTAVKIGIKGADDNIVWHEYVSGEKTVACHQLSFNAEADPTAKAIRNAIWGNSSSTN